jgi:uncharacterized repeat protein (TIGR01451 family)
MIGESRLRGIIKSRLGAIIGSVLLCCLPSLASAQTVNQFTNSTAAAIVDSPSCATTVTRTFSVGTSFSVSDVNVGVLISHKYRSDLRITLSSPTGTTVQILNASGGSANNLNVLFDDEAAASIVTHLANDNTGIVPPFQRSFRPGAVLSAFDGQNAQGTWALTICDAAANDTGNFLRADLYISQVQASFADLSLRKNVSNINPSSGTNVTYTLIASNSSASTVSATGVTVLDVLPVGVSFVSSTGTGAYNSATGIWTVGTLAPNGSATINITVTVVAATGAVVTSGAEILSSSAADNDSTPNNGSTDEDDDAFVSFPVGGGRTAGIPPTLICPSGSALFDWDAVSWTAGSTNNSYVLANVGTINFSISINGGTFLSNASTGGQSPARQTNFTGGLSPVQTSLIQLVDMGSLDATATTTISLPTAVPGAQFRLFDIDYTAAEFADRATVTGTFNGSPVTPTLTNSLANYVVGNTAYGDAGAANSTSNGNVVVTFSSPVDTIVIVYGNHSIAPVNPFSQAITIHDIDFCKPQANVTVSKISNIVSDGVSASSPKALPEAIVSYCILISNAGSGTATSISVTDALPATIDYIAGTLASGPSCTAFKIAEDDDASGADESDPFGASISGTTISASAVTMAPNSAFAITFNATVK